MKDAKEPRAHSQLVGRYANFFQVGHTAFEFVIDFGQSYQGGIAEQHHTRIITSPAYAVELLRLLDDSITRYEGTFGAIPKT